MSEVTQILGKIESGDPSAAEQLLPLVYDELRKLAARAARLRGGNSQREPGNEPLRRWPTDVVQFGQSLPPQEGHNPRKQHNGKTYYIPMEVLGWTTNLALRKGETWKTRPLATLVDIYHGAINGGANLAMLVWPNRQGKLSADQVQRLLELGRRVQGLKQQESPRNN